MPPRLPSRLTLPDAYQRFAEALALRSTDGSQKVGCVVVSPTSSACSASATTAAPRAISDRDFIPSDRSGYVHAEENALLKAGAIEKDKIMFITHTPCVMCAKRAINSGVAKVYCRQPNVRGDAMGVEVLRRAGKEVIWWHEAGDRRAYGRCPRRRAVLFDIGDTLVSVPPSVPAGASRRRSA